MKEKINTFLASDLLEKYLLGDTSKEETQQTERYIAMYPEVRGSYEELQKNLQIFAQQYAMPTPQGLKEVILSAAKQDKKFGRRFYKYAVAASVAIMLFAGTSYFLWDQNRSLQEENTLVTNQIKYLESNMMSQLEDMRNQFIVLNNPDTRKVEVKGKKEGKDLKAIAYINPVKKLSFINVGMVPQLPENQVFQLWAEVNGELVNLGVIKEFDDKEKLLAMPYGEKAIGYITVEPEGGNASPSVENIVANISF